MRVCRYTACPILTKTTSHYHKMGQAESLLLRMWLKHRCFVDMNICGTVGPVDPAMAKNNPYGSVLSIPYGQKMGAAPAPLSCARPLGKGAKVQRKPLSPDRCGSWEDPPHLLVLIPPPPWRSWPRRPPRSSPCKCRKAVWKRPRAGGSRPPWHPLRCIPRLCRQPLQPRPGPYR